MRTRWSAVRLFTAKDGCTRLVLIGSFTLALLSPTALFGQDASPSHWGVSASATPSWEISASVKELLGDEDETVNIKGSEFTIGFVRGSTLGGDWGVSYVRKPWDDGVGFSSSSTQCLTIDPSQPPLCPRSSDKTIFERVALTGVEVHWFIAPRFARIRDRVQIGANIAGGIAKVSGTTLTVSDFQYPVPVFTPGPGGFRFRLENEHVEERSPASEEILPVLPLLKVELMGAVIATPALKIKVAGGVNFPGTGFRVLGVYLFGAK
jgi:hypothetical protein